MYGYQQLTRNKDATYFTAITKAKKSKASKIQLIQQKRRYACPPDSFLDLAKFSYLELDLGYSKMLDFEATFEMLAKLPGLQVLSLVKCHSKNFPKNIEKLTNLKTLWIRNNEFEVMPNELANLEKLEELHARSCAMKQFPKPVLELKNLKKLTLSNNKFAALPDELFELTNLEYLDIGTCGLTKISEKIGQLKNLKTLILDKNKLTKLPKVLFKMPKLEKISIVGNQNLDLVEYFKLLEKLGTEELNFADFGKIKAIPEKLFEKSPNQWVLRIGKNPIKSIPEHFPEHFKVTDSNNYLRIYYPHNLGIPYQKIQQLREAYPRLVLLT